MLFVRTSLMQTDLLQLGKHNQQLSQNLTSENLNCFQKQPFKVKQIVTFKVQSYFYRQKSQTSLPLAAEYKQFI